MAIRISKVTRELNVGSTTLVEFLHKKGFPDVNDDLNEKLTEEQYQLLVAEFSRDKSLREAANRFLQDRLSKRPKAEEKEEKPAQPEPVMTVETLGTEIPQDMVPKFKTVGKIDLGKPGKATVKGAAKSAKVAETPKRPEAVKPAAPKKTEPAKEPEPVEEKKVDEVQVKPLSKLPADEPKAESQPTVATAPVKQEEPAHEEVKSVAEPEPAPVVAKEEEPAVETALPEAPGEPEPKAEEASQKSEEPAGESIFKIEAPKDGGLKLKTVGKIDLTAINQSTRPKKKSKEEKRKEREEKEQLRQKQRQQFKDSLMKEIKPAAAGGEKQGEKSGDKSGGPRKKNRIRIGGEKVDISKAENYGQGHGSSDNRGKDSQKGGSGRNNKDRRHNKNEKSEFSNEDVNRQIRDTFSSFQKGKTKSSKYRKDKREQVQMRQQEAMEQEMAESKVLKLTEFVTANELATMMNIPVTQVISTCMSVGIMVSINQRLDAETINIVAEEYGFTTDFVSAEVAQQISEEADREEDLVPRAPIVTVMGHVDHGKTSLLDYIRKSNVIAGEAGGITQHIGAYNVKLDDGRHITFLDTPGHEAFTAMRARGAQVTDIAIIIVAADDNVMPQTKEAIAHATAAGVPIVFAINKVDKPAADPERIKQELAQMNFLVEDWGGKYQSQDISAKKGIGVNELMEKVLLEAEMLDLKANPNRKATGTIIESSLDKGRGYVATVLVSNGTLKMGDIVIAGTSWGKVKAMFNERNQKMKSAAPAEPVLILGLNGAPQAGVSFHVVDSEREAREITGKREQLQREQGVRTTQTLTLDELGRRIKMGDFHELNLIVKADVDGSVEALSDSLIKLSTPNVQVNVIHKAVGAISESDVSLAAASNAIIIGFDVRPSGAAKRLAEQNDVDIRIYSIIYDAIDEVKSAMEGLLAPKVKEEVTSTIEVMEVFHISKVGMVAGCRVRDGKVSRNDKARVIRDGIVIHTGDILALKRFKDDVKEVQTGMECGLSLVSYNDLQEGDMIETFTQIEVKQTL
ncbi:MAG: translation initiation factor IF-2 [Bacteroidaceae bacterium]|nr:translation initiation factor IF-2 [Bacteroidaceae bacterium]